MFSLGYATIIVSRYVGRGIHFRILIKKKTKMLFSSFARAHATALEKGFGNNIRTNLVSEERSFLKTRTCPVNPTIYVRKTIFYISGCLRTVDGRIQPGENENGGYNIFGKHFFLPYCSFLFLFLLFTKKGAFTGPTSAGFAVERFGFRKTTAIYIW